MSHFPETGRSTGRTATALSLLTLTIILVEGAVVPVQALMPPSAQPPTAAGDGRVVTDHINASTQTRSYGLAAELDDYLVAELRPEEGRDIDLELRTPEGEVVLRSSEPPGRLDAVAFLADERGSWKVVVDNPHNESANYTLSMRATPPPQLGEITGDAPRIAVLDTGIDWTHLEFDEATLVAWKDFIGDVRGIPRAAPYDDHRHGTAVASLAVGESFGPILVADLAVGKVLDHRGIGTWDAVVDGIRWADHVVEADIIVMSLGVDTPLPGATDVFYPGLGQAIRDAHANGSLLVVANGNGQYFPGELHPLSWSTHTFSVGSSDRRGTVSRSSNPNPEVIAWGDSACVARASGRPYPGDSPRCKDGDTRYGLVSGSSFATPRVAGWAASLISDNPRLEDRPEETEAVMHQAATDRLHVPYTEEGFGFYNDTAHAVAQEIAIDRGTSTQPGWMMNQAVHASSDAIKFIYGDGGDIV